MTGIIDYGAGNLASAANAFRALGADVCLALAPGELERCDRLVLPGVGAFPAAMRRLTETGFVEPLQRWASQGRPLLGICLGMQLLVEVGFEHEEALGLGILPGQVVRLEPAGSLPVPHVGWNDVTPVQPHPMAMPSCVYFTHSYHVVGAGEALLATADYGGATAATIGSGSVVGMQFHPEKSHQDGLHLLQAFLDWNP